MAQCSRLGIQTHEIDAARERDAAGGYRCRDVGFEEAALDCHPVSGHRSWVDGYFPAVDNNVIDVTSESRFPVVRISTNWLYAGRCLSSNGILDGKDELIQMVLDTKIRVLG